MAFFVYILANKRNGTIYIGMTDDLVKRVWQHRNEVIPGFSKRYGVKNFSFGTRRMSRESQLLPGGASSRNGTENGSWN